MIVSPGANQVLVLQSGILLGPKAAILNVLGVASSMFVHASLSSLGISLLIMKSPYLHTLIKALGAGYIVYLAISSLINSYRLYKTIPADNQVAAAIASPPDVTNLQSFTKGFTTNVLNIQTSFIFLSIFPQYMNEYHGLFIQSLFLTMVFILLLLSWYSLLISLIFKAREYLIQPRMQCGVKAITGLLLLIIGIKMVLK
ncbi:Threonine efflux protein [bioreactor metagenome]|uniref:Threonine efflux protein n=1 Tax=bioreactor metagenome TaxID=1076179 RepID=A0A645C2S7_9ZZZZ